MNLWLVLLSVVVAPAVPAQDAPAAQQAKPEPSPQLTVRVELVNLDVTVSDAKGQFVTGLQRENFRVLDEGAEQPVTHFASVEAPAQVLVLVEASPAVYLIQQEHLRAAYALLDGLAASDRVALGTYAQAARLALDFTEDKRALAEALGGLRYNLGVAELNLLDSMDAALGWLAPLSGKKAIILLTTGLDTSPSGRREVLERKLRESEVVVLPVALGGELRPSNRSRKSSRGGKPPRSELGEESTGLSFAQADRDLQTMAELTGGCAYFPKGSGEFQAIYRQIADLLRHEYSLGFLPPARDARFHRIEVQVVGAGGQPLHNKDGSPLYRIRARPGYLAPAP